MPSLARRWLICTLISFLALLLISGGGLWWYLHPPYTLEPAIVYGQRHNAPLTLHLIRPERPNGLGILFLASSQWKSHPGKIRPWMAAPLLRQGYVIIAVCHRSQPEATIQESIEDMHRAVRFVRHHAREWGVQPAPLGVVGGSSGGHLSLMLATCGGPGPADAADPIDREDSSVQAAAVFFPVTDLLNLGPSTENAGDNGPPRNYVKAFGPLATQPNHWQSIGRATSPIYHITPALPPILIAHGDADTLVPIEQSQRFQQVATQHNRSVELLIRPGKGHGWFGMLWDVRLFAQWFEQKLRPDT